MGPTMCLFKLPSVSAAGGAGPGITVWGPQANCHPLWGKDEAWLVTCTPQLEVEDMEQLG